MFILRSPSGLLRQTRRTVCLLPSALLLACSPEYPTTPDDRALVVHGMLGAGTSQQEIIVEYTRPLRTGYSRALTPASGLRVMVSGTEPHLFVEDPTAPGVYRASFLPRPGERYTLEVVGSAGEDVRGETIIPEQIRLTTPGQDTAVVRASRTLLAWTRAPSAAGYVMLSGEPGQPASLPEVVGSRFVLQDTTINTEFGLLGGNRFHVAIVAVDANYRRYALLDDQGEGERDRNSLRTTVQGGYGLFGAYSRSNSREVVIR